MAAPSAGGREAERDRTQLLKEGKVKCSLNLVTSFSRFLSDQIILRSRYSLYNWDFKYIVA